MSSLGLLECRQSPFRVRLARWSPSMDLLAVLSERHRLVVYRMNFQPVFAVTLPTLDERETLSCQTPAVEGDDSTVISPGLITDPRNGRSVCCRCVCAWHGLPCQTLGWCARVSRRSATVRSPVGSKRGRSTAEGKTSAATTPDRARETPQGERWPGFEADDEGWRSSRAYRLAARVVCGVGGRRAAMTCGATSLAWDPTGRYITVGFCGSAGRLLSYDVARGSMVPSLLHCVCCPDDSAAHVVAVGDNNGDDNAPGPVVAIGYLSVDQSGYWTDKNLQKTGCGERVGGRVRWPRYAQRLAVSIRPFAAVTALALAAAKLDFEPFRLPSVMPPATILSRGSFTRETWEMLGLGLAAGLLGYSPAQRAGPTGEVAAAALEQVVRVHSDSHDEVTLRRSLAASHGPHVASVSGTTVKSGRGAVDGAEAKLCGGADADFARHLARDRALLLSSQVARQSTRSVVNDGRKRGIAPPASDLQGDFAFPVLVASYMDGSVRGWAVTGGRGGVLLFSLAVGRNTPAGGAQGGKVPLSRVLPYSVRSAGNGCGVEIECTEWPSSSVQTGMRRTLVSASSWSALGEYAGEAALSASCIASVRLSQRYLESLMHGCSLLWYSSRGPFVKRMKLLYTCMEEYRAYLLRVKEKIEAKSAECTPEDTALPLYMEEELEEEEVAMRRELVGAAFRGITSPALITFFRDYIQVKHIHQWYMSTCTVLSYISLCVTRGAIPCVKRLRAVVQMWLDQCRGSRQYEASLGVSSQLLLQLGNVYDRLLAALLQWNRLVVRALSLYQGFFFWMLCMRLRVARRRVFHQFKRKHRRRERGDAPPEEAAFDDSDCYMDEQFDDDPPAPADEDESSEEEQQEPRVTGVVDGVSVSAGSLHRLKAKMARFSKMAAAGAVPLTERVVAFIREELFQDKVGAFLSKMTVPSSSESPPPPSWNQILQQIRPDCTLEGMLQLGEQLPTSQSEGASKGSESLLAWLNGADKSHRSEETQTWGRLPADKFAQRLGKFCACGQVAARVSGVAPEQRMQDMLAALCECTRRINANLARAVSEDLLRGTKTATGLRFQSSTGFSEPGRCPEVRAKAQQLAGCAVPDRVSRAGWTSAALLCESMSQSAHVTQLPVGWLSALQGEVGPGVEPAATLGMMAGGRYDGWTLRAQVAHCDCVGGGGRLPMLVVTCVPNRGKERDGFVAVLSLQDHRSASQSDQQMCALEQVTWYRKRSDSRQTMGPVCVKGSDGGVLGYRLNGQWELAVLWRRLLGRGGRISSRAGSPKRRAVGEEGKSVTVAEPPSDLCGAQRVSNKSGVSVLAKLRLADMLFAPVREWVGSGDHETVEEALAARVKAWKPLAQQDWTETRGGTEACRCRGSGCVFAPVCPRPISGDAPGCQPWVGVCRVFAKPCRHISLSAERAGCAVTSSDGTVVYLVDMEEEDVGDSDSESDESSEEEDFSGSDEAGSGFSGSDEAGSSESRSE